ncbi:ABC transporter permease [uncultured Methanobrevibacter sp.]|uniref:ABC transporter permease n=1 Tax=uncultured Methanobrevibacter sp. TaxID=253161 RepID=UPI0025EA4C5E|nr:FtsX-like permease family protein [uncultured Methanobrevibacter sp.]
MHELNKSLWSMIYALMIFAVLLALIIMYNLGLLSFLEMERDIGTLKVLGFKTADLTKLLLTQSLAFIIIGGLLRIPLAYKVLEKAWESSSEKFFAVPSISLTNLAITFLLILAVSILINLNFAYKIKKLDMAEALKILE